MHIQWEESDFKGSGGNVFRWEPVNTVVIKN